MAFTTISYDVVDRILTITLDRPDAMNSFTVTMAEELVTAFERASADLHLDDARSLAEALDEHFNPLLIGQELVRETSRDQLGVF